MTYSVEAMNDTGGMACKVTASEQERQVRDRDRLHHRSEPEHRADARRLRAQAEAKGPTLQLFVRFDPTVNGNGGGGAGNGGADSATVDASTGHPILVASDPVTDTNAANRDYAQPVFAALDGSFTEASTGFAGSESDGLVQLDAAHALTPTFPDARDGNVVGTARVALDGNGKTVLALGFGATQDEAVGAAEGSLAVGFDKSFGDYKNGWTSTTPRSRSRAPRSCPASRCRSARSSRTRTT